ncbi:MAG: DNA polymerase III subunit gamma/tau [Chlamydiales bacterium]|nr:DNA polymerase III subunit gamma/tau [Chlamydiales bacterium]
MAEYQVLARKYRPQRFSDVVGQDPIVTTLKNMMRFDRIAHAFLFCGSRGTGKTTLARLFAKALNCQALSAEFEPCNECSSCKEITGGHSLDILEIDGASHRGIEDVRKITETVGYSAASGHYKIYIIDEVHMLTKEAFNALLKTLEEPPPKVKFFFATTEPHKVLPTILSRCQRFNLNRISLDSIIATLQKIATDIGAQVHPDALRLIATMADGGMRDAESLFDQVLAFHEGEITVDAIAKVLGIMPRDIFFQIDQAGKNGDLAQAFEVVEQVFSQGKDLLFFLEGLIEHFRNILVVKLSGKATPLLNVASPDRDRYEASALLYRKEQCMNLLDYLIEAQNQIRFSPSSRIALEAVVLHIMRSHQRLPVEHLVKELIQLEAKLNGGFPAAAPAAPVIAAQEPPKRVVQAPSISEDPTPAPQDLPRRPATPKSAPVSSPPPIPASPAPDVVAVAPENSGDVKDLMKKQSRYDTVTHFAAIELGGTLQKTSIK